MVEVVGALHVLFYGLLGGRAESDVVISRTRRLSFDRLISDRTRPRQAIIYWSIVGFVVSWRGLAPHREA